ncbi:MAG: hypothetical protein H7Z16_11115 [Pyrinomonadaceae bacterium]|nr:hypothetical protein [Pyrinomonadaceae bacterium]
MYCSTCATPLTPGLSYCNRCGASLKERDDPKSGAISTQLISAITVLGIAGLGLMLGGAIALKNGAQFHEELIGIFMFMTFSLVGVVEFFLCRQLSKVIGGKENARVISPQQPVTTAELRGPQPRSLPEPLPSVTENTTRTLDYSRNEPTR